MAVRFVALLIPLAITLPQLQASRRAAAPAPQPDAVVEYETRHVADAALSRVVLEPPVHETVRSHNAAIAEPVVAAVPAAAIFVPTEIVQPALRRTAPKLARAGSPVKLVSAAPAPGRLTTRAAKRGLADAGCLPGAHCAPVVVAKVTLVVRRPL